MARPVEDILAEAMAKAGAKTGAAGTNGQAQPAKPKPAEAARPKAPLPSVRRVPAWTPFPLAHLPASLRRLCEDGSQAMRCDPSYIALPGLSVLASAIGATRTLSLKRTWREPSILWTVVVGDSGTLKTPAYRLAFDPILETEKRNRNNHRILTEAYEEEAEAHRAEKKGEAPKKPPRMPRIRVSDITVERLACILDENPRGVLVARDELAGWFGSFMKYKAAGAGSDIPNWLEMYQGNSVVVDRKTGDRPSLFIERAVVSVMGGIQPGTLARALKEEFYESGLVARLLLAWPPKKRKEWTEADVPEETTGAWKRCVDALLGFQFVSVNGNEEPRLIEPDGEAKALWIDWYNEWAVEQDDSEGEVSACYSKIEAVAARLALIHHCALLVETKKDRPLGAESMAAGIALARWFAAEALRVYALSRASDAEQQAIRLVEWIRKRGGKAFPRDLQRANSSRYPASEDAEAALQVLIDARMGEWQHGEKPATGSFAARWFVLNEPEVPFRQPDNPTTGGGVVGLSDVGEGGSVGKVHSGNHECTPEPPGGWPDEVPF